MSHNVSLHTLKHRKWILAALMFTIMLAAMDATIVSTAIPQIVGDLGGFSLFSWVFSIYLLAQTVTIPIYGKLADLYGRKPVLLFGIVVFLIGSAVSAASWNMISLILFRGLQGIGAGSMMATVNTLAGDLYSVRERAKIQGWLSSVWGMAAIVGPTIGGALAEYATWRWIFLINIPIGIVSIILISLYLKENVKKKEHYIDYAGAISLLALGVMVIFTLMEGGQAWEWMSVKGISMMAACVFLLGITVFIQENSPEPIVPNFVLSNSTLLGANLAMIAMGAIMLGPNMYLPIFGQSVLGLNAISAGLVLASISIGWPIASSLSGLLYLKIGFRNTSMIGVVVIITASLLFLLFPFDGSVWQLVANHILLGAGFGLLSTPNLVGIQSIVGWDKRGVVTSSNMFSRYLGQSLGAAILGGVFNKRMSNWLSEAPADIKGYLPEDVNDIIETLQSGATSPAVKDYLRHAFYGSSSAVYLTMAIIGVLAILFLFLQPKKFDLVKD